MKKKIALAVLLFAGSAFAVAQQMDLNVSRFLTAFRTGILIGRHADNPSDTQINGNRITRSLGASATIDFAASSGAQELSSAITVLGARAGDACSVGPNATAGALKGQFECFVSASDAVKVRFTPMSVQSGTATLVTGTPSTVVVASITASSICTATPVGTTAAIAGAGLAVSLTTTNLTITGPDSVTTVVNYSCRAPVDPASGTFYIRVNSSQ